MRKESGFTVMEAGIGIFIILTILAFAAPTVLSVVAAYNLSSATREVATDLWQARSLAVNGNSAFRVDFAAGSYRVVRLSDNAVVKARSLAKYNVGTTDGSITFHSRGTSSSGSVVLSNHLRTKTVDVNLLGRVRIS